MASKTKQPPGIGHGDELPITTNVHRQTTRSSAFLRLFKYLALCSTALILTTILPSPWSFIHFGQPSSTVPLNAATQAADPASQWKDDIWPFRPQSPWDISTDFPYPRKLEYDVQEGTWLRLDVHPKSGDIVFDMIGDLYCLPAADVAEGGITRARPILVGIPHDSDPHFSPEGERLVFRSDAELGVENIWVMSWKGCKEMDVRTVHGEEVVHGGKETAEEKYNRLLKEGRQGALRVTNETYRWVSDARFHPSGSSVIATKWYTSARSIGAGESWQYPVSSVGDLQAAKQHKIKAGDGKRIIGRDLPRGWSAEQYGDQQIGPEQPLWNGDSIIYSKNVRDESTFQYSKGLLSTSMLVSLS